MGCQVELSTNQLFFRTIEVKMVSLLHFARALFLIILPPIWADFTGIAMLVGAVEILIAGWIWSLRIESWGISMGMTLLHILFPMLAWISPLIHGGIVVICAIQVALLLKIRYSGGYSFDAMVSVDTAEKREATSIQQNMFNLTVVAQLIKTLFVFLGAISFLIILGPFEPIPWLHPLPLAPTALVLGLIDFVALIQLRRGIDWGFHLTLIMAPLSVVESLLTLLQPILLIGIWIPMLVAPCWARDGFYAKLFSRLHE